MSVVRVPLVVGVRTIRVVSCVCICVFVCAEVCVYMSTCVFIMVCMNAFLMYVCSNR
jgi:hypothetical protein